MSQPEMDFEPRYYTLDRTPESEQFLFAHNGLFNLWNKILIFRWNDINVVLIDSRGSLKPSSSKEGVQPTKELTEAIYAFWDYYTGVLGKCLREMLEGAHAYTVRDFYISYVALIKNMLTLTKACINKEAT